MHPCGTASNLSKFNPVDLALQLLDDSGELTRGKDMTSFRQTKDMLSRALKGSVDSTSIYTSCKARRMTAFCQSITKLLPRPFRTTLPY